MAQQEYFTGEFNRSYIMDGISAMPGGFFVYKADDQNEEIIYANRALLQLLECDDPEQFLELTGGSFRGIVYKEDYDRVSHEIVSQLKENTSKFDQVSYRIKTRTGQIKYVEDFGSYVEDPEKGPLFYVFVSDPQDYIDPVTGLINRKVFFRNAERKRKNAGENHIPVVIAFDLSGMSGFNERFGFAEGDKLLRTFGEVLQNYFSHDLCTRFGEDHFCAYFDESGTEEILSELVDEFKDCNSGNTIPVKAGICVWEDEMTIYYTYERARLACQSQKSFYGSSIGYYDDTMAKDFSKNEYILRNLDKALENGWIKVFLQPVIRSLSGKVCSAEALTRWADPELGFISPGEFIPLLERTGLSYKLDAYMVHNVAKLISRNIKDGNDPVPVSVNISRNDFLYCDPVQVVTEALDEYNLDRSLICVEITESAFSTQPEIIKDAIERFHYEGIEVWMDDFGSGYSSLNVLKDFDFDEIKIDMAFLRNFGEKSKVIITKAVQMAKELGIHTLAEGVETEEHVEFLKNIGCEKIQGFYYAKPMAYELQLKNLKKNGFEFEDKETSSVYEKTGLVNLATDQSKALFFYSSGVFNPVYLNQKYSETIGRAGMTNDQVIEKNMNSDTHHISKKFKELAEKAVNSKETEYMTFVARDHYFNFTFTDVADSRKGSMLLASIERTSFVEQEKSRELDDIFRNIGSIYDSIYLLDLEEDTRTVIATNLKTEKVGDKVKGLKKFFLNFHARDIYQEDLERWQDFVRRGSFQSIFKETGKGIFADAIRMKNDDGNYSWIDFTVIQLPESDGKRFLSCVRPSVLEFQPDLADAVKPWRHSVSEEINLDLNLFRSIMNESNLKVFWKDMDRRFVGVNRNFLNFYGIKSEEGIIGHTDEEMAWHIDDSRYLDDELRVLNKGETILFSIGKNIINGSIHNISATKFPVYDNGVIVGLMGYVVDLHEDIRDEERISRGMHLDPVTGMMNFSGQMNDLIERYDNFIRNQEVFIFGVFSITNFIDIARDFGKDVAESLMRLMAITLLNSFGSGAVISRIYGCVFSVTLKSDNKDRFIEKAEKAVSILKNTKEIDNRTFNIRPVYGISLSTEKISVQEMTELARRRMDGSEPPLA